MRHIRLKSVAVPVRLRGAIKGRSGVGFGMPNMEPRSPDDPFLAPVEEPADPAMRQVYANQEARFGKVLTLAKVLHARMPVAFAQYFGNAFVLDRQLVLPPETALLIRERVARMNVCLFCIDSIRAAVIRASMNQAKFDALEEYGSNPLFTAAERAALDYTTQLTREKRIDPSKFDRLAEYFSDREICDIVYLVASEHLINMLSIGMNVHSDLICDIAKKAKAADVRSSTGSL